MDKTNQELNDRLQKLEKENLQLRAELELRKAGQAVQQTTGNFFSKATTRVVAGARLKKSVKTLVNELPGTPSKEAISDVLVSLVMRLTRLGAFAILVAAAPLLIMGLQTFILNRQNHKLTEQNELLARQNQRLDQQINLEEGSRRSSLVFFMSNILDRMEDELRNNRTRKLSDELIGRIVSLSQALRPYRYLENDELTERQLSPERGQLLFSLINSNLHEATYDKIYERANFNYADLQEANFSGGYMKAAKLANSYFYKANFNEANLEGADLSYAYLVEATFTYTKMDRADLSYTNLRKSVMEDISMQNGNLEMADLREIYLEGDFRGCWLEGIIIQKATLANVDLRGCRFRSEAWLDSLRNYRLKGFSSLVDYYEPVIKFQPKGLFVDTVFQLELDKNSPALEMITCNQAAHEIVASSWEVIQAKQRESKAGSNIKLYPVKSPYPLEDLGVLQDSLFLFKLSASKEPLIKPLMWIQYNHRLQELWEIDPTGNHLLRKLDFDTKLLNREIANCD
ncbi:MAG: pentapeptide repeat-containing protein [Bacteroidota bacterium]